MDARTDIDLGSVELAEGWTKCGYSAGDGKGVILRAKPGAGARLVDRVCAQTGPLLSASPQRIGNLLEGLVQAGVLQALARDQTAGM